MQASVSVPKEVVPSQQETRSGGRGAVQADYRESTAATRQLLGVIHSSPHLTVQRQLVTVMNQGVGPVQLMKRSQPDIKGEGDDEREEKARRILEATKKGEEVKKTQPVIGKEAEAHGVTRTTTAFNAADEMEGKSQHQGPHIIPFATEKVATELLRRNKVRRRDLIGTPAILSKEEAIDLFKHTVTHDENGNKIELDDKVQGKIDKFEKDYSKVHDEVLAYQKDKGDEDSDYGSDDDSIEKRKKGHCIMKAYGLHPGGVYKLGEGTYSKAEIAGKKESCKGGGEDGFVLLDHDFEDNPKDVASKLKQVDGLDKITDRHLEASVRRSMALVHVAAGKDDVPVNDEGDKGGKQ